MLKLLVQTSVADLGHFKAKESTPGPRLGPGIMLCLPHAHAQGMMGIMYPDRRMGRL